LEYLFIFENHQHQRAQYFPLLWFTNIVDITHLGKVTGRTWDRFAELSQADFYLRLSQVYSVESVADSTVVPILFAVVTYEGSRSTGGSPICCSKPLVHTNLSNTQPIQVQLQFAILYYSAMCVHPACTRSARMASKCSTNNPGLGLLQKQMVYHGCH